MTRRDLKDLAGGLFILIGTPIAGVLLLVPNHAWQVLVGLVLFIALAIVATREHERLKEQERKRRGWP